MRVIKWILSEQNATYKTNEYYKKCKKLELLPLKLRMDYFAISLFHKIIHKEIPIKLPSYIKLAPCTNLRYSHNDPLTFQSIIKPRIIRKPNKTLNSNKGTSSRKHKNKKNIPMTKVIPSNKHVKCKRKKASKFFKMRKNNEVIYKQDEKLNDEFTGDKAFSNSYFYKTLGQWNHLPTDIKIIENHDKFIAKLKDHMWDTLIKSIEDDESYNDPSFLVPTN